MKTDKDDKQSTLVVPCKQSDKAKWVKAASGKKLAQWVIDQLNKSVEK